jgi:hypothetical protein
MNTGGRGRAQAIQKREREKERKTLRITGIEDSTSPRDLIELFDEQSYYVFDVEIHFNPMNAGADALVQMSADDAASAQLCVNGRRWRGQNIEIELMKW